MIGVLLFAGCGTVGGTDWPRGDRVREAFTKVQAADAEAMPLDSRAFELRRQARLEYRAATEAGRSDEARRLLDRAQVDAELSLALARQASWQQQANERTAMLQEMQAAPAAGAGR
jgi:hypothetical protein